MNKTFTVLNPSFKCLFTLFICLITRQGWSQQNLYVDSAATGANNGSSWADAYAQLRTALTAAASIGGPVHIHVAKGTYYPTGNQSTSRIEAFTLLRDNIKLYGGYPTGGGVRDIAVNPVYLDGNIDNAGSNSGNSYHVMVIAGVTLVDSLIIDGFSFRNGNARGLDYSFYNGVEIGDLTGGALVIQQNSNGQKIRVLNCHFVGNSARNGGAVATNQSDVCLENCVFTSNSTIGTGGAIVQDRGKITISQSLFIGNSSPKGGAISSINGEIVISGTYFETNSSEFGGAIYNRENTFSAVSTTQFNNNSASVAGGAIFQERGNTLITGSSFTHNQAQYGGAVRSQYTHALMVKKSIFNGNTSTNTGAALSLAEGIDTLVNNLFIRNKDNSSIGGGAICLFGGNFSVVNNTFYADTTTGGRGGAIRLEGSGGAAKLQNNIFYKCQAVSGNDVYNDAGMPYSEMNNSFSIDPVFVGEASPIGADNTWSTADDGLILGSSSPVANGGNTTGINNSLPPTDLAGNPRIIGGTIDIGAYESPVAAPHVLHVDSTYGNDGNSGGSWVFPHKTLAQALTVAHTSGSTVDTIHVAKGTYFPTGTQGGSDRDSAFTILRAGIKLYGGYPAGGGARDLVANRVYLDGNINNPADSTDNSYHVLLIVEARNGTDSVVMDGFTIRNGNASKTFEGKPYKGIYVPRYTGGGGYIVFNTPFNHMRFSNCNVTHNTAVLEGGGIYNINSSPLMAHCSFIGNKAGTDGGGLYNSTASPLMDSCIMAGNTAQNGAGMYNTNTSGPIVRNSRFIGNIAAGFGGGMDSRDNSNPVLEGNEFTGNKAKSGGALYGLYATTPITRCRFEGNEATEGGGALFHTGGLFMINRSVFIGNKAQYGGAIRNDQINTLSVRNSVFVSNTSTNTGAALSLFQGSDTLVNNAFIRNKDNSTAGGGAICAANGNFHIINNTFYADSSTNGKGGAIRLETPFGYCNLYNNIFYKCYAGAADNDVHNVNGLPLNQSHNSYSIDPRFVGENDLDGGDDTWGTNDDGLSLDFCSPVINVGNDALLPAGTETDIANMIRPWHAAVDLGAYEASSAFSLNEDNPTKTANGTCSIDGWVNYYEYYNPDLLLSIKPGTNDLGTVTAISHLRTGYGTNNTAVLTTPFGNTNNLHPFNRSWTITTANPPADSVGVRFYFGTRDSSDVRGAIPFNRLRDLVLYKVNGANAWDPAATGYVEYKYGEAASKTTFTLGRYQALQYAEFYVTSFSSGSMASLPLAALPLDLISFTGRLVNEKTKLQWLTSTEVNVAHFEIERSSNNGGWIKIGQVAARNRAGNQQYELWDNNPASSTNHYRLKMVDIDGDFKYSKVVTVSTNGSSIHVYPNPNNGQFAVEINNAGRSASLQLFDASGKSVHRQRLVQGINQVNVKWLSGGIYVLKIEDEWNSHVERLIINK